MSEAVAHSHDVLEEIAAGDVADLGDLPNVDSAMSEDPVDDTAEISSGSQ